MNKVYAIAILVGLFVVVPATGLPILFGTEIQAGAGLSPALVIGEASLSLTARAEITPSFNLFATAGGGYSFFFIQEYVFHWFHFCASVQPQLVVPVAANDLREHQITLTPVGLYLSWSPEMYILAGPESSVGYRITSARLNWEVFRLSLRALWRDTDLDFKWHFQAAASIGLSFGARR